jgi:hypothetical protein
MVAAVGGHRKSGESADDEARLRKQIKDRAGNSQRTHRQRLVTTLMAFDEPQELDEQTRVLQDSLSLDALHSLTPQDAVKKLSEFGDSVRKHLTEVGKKALSTHTWVSKAWHNGDLYKQTMVHIIIGLEFKRLAAEKRFQALDQVYALAKENTDSADLDEAIANFDATVRRYTQDRESIVQRELNKKAKLARASTTVSAAPKPMRPRVVESELDMILAEDGNGDEDDKESDVGSMSSNSEEQAAKHENGDSHETQVFDKIVSGKAKLAQSPATFLNQRSFVKVGEAFAEGSTVADVERDLIAYARRQIENLAKQSLDAAPEEAASASAEAAEKKSFIHELMFRSSKSDPSEDKSALEDDDDAMSAFGRSMQQLSNAELRGTIVRLLRNQIWETFENPGGSNVAYMLAIFFMSLIFVSSFAFCLETLPRFEGDAQAGDIFYGIEVFSLVMFTLEYVLRSLCCPKWTKFVVQPLNIVDLVAILPFYLQLTLPMSVDSIQVVRTIRLVRVLRILRLGVKFGRLKIIGLSIAECGDMLLVSMAIGGLAIVIFSTLIYYAEHGDYIAAQGIYARNSDVACDNLDASVTSIWNSDGTLISDCTYVESPYKSIPASFWWCVVTLMTVGYGDNVPVTSAGKLIASLTMVCSVLLLALPISVIGTEFTRQWIDYKADVEYERDRKIVAPRFQKLIKATRLQLKAAQETQQDMRSRQMSLDDKIQTIKSLVMRRTAETMFLKRKIVARSGLSVIGFEKFEQQLDMDDLDVEMRGMFMTHKEYKQTLREVDTIWSGDQLQRFSEFLINANHVLEGLCNDDFDMVSQEVDSLFFEAWRVKSKLMANFGPGVQTKKRWKRAGMVAKFSSTTESKERK